MEPLLPQAHEVIARCRLLAQFTEEPGFTTRTFLSPPMRDVHAQLAQWMEHAGASVRVDPAGNLRCDYTTSESGARRLYVASHLDTVPHAGAFDGILGVVLGLALIELLDKRKLGFGVEVVGFSEEEGVRFGVPFIGSRAFVGTADDELLSRHDSRGMQVREVIREYGLDPERISEAVADPNAIGYLEFHIEQGPVLESLNLPLGVVDAIVGQSRFDVVFAGAANHAGTTPMHLRRDALAGAAEWIGMVERRALSVSGLVATVGRAEVHPGAGNVIAGHARVSLDVRHASDGIRHHNVEGLLACARQIAGRRGLSVTWEPQLDQPAAAMDAALTESLASAVARCGHPIHRMPSGAGHDAMAVAARIPAAMLFLRSPGGVSHHPDESVLVEDVAAALATGLELLNHLDRQGNERHA